MICAAHMDGMTRESGAQSLKSRFILEGVVGSLKNGWRKSASEGNIL